MDAEVAFSEQAAQHEAAHAVIGFRYGIAVRFGITLDPVVIGCWEAGKGVAYIGCSPDYSPPHGPPCAQGLCARLGGRGECRASQPNPYPGIRALYVGRVPTLYEVRCHRETDPEWATELAKGAICSALAAGCLMKHFGHTGDLGTRSDEDYARYFAEAVLPRDRATGWVEALREQTGQQVREPRNLALVEEIVRALELPAHHTMWRDRLEGILGKG
jgi:hypothetical protein